MGQQQLLLIVIGTVIVGIAIFIAINLASTYARDANRDAVINDINNIAMLAKQHYHKPLALGGGGYSFTNFTIPPNLLNTPNGNYVNASKDVNSLIIIGQGKEIGNDGVNKVKVTAIITADNVKIEINN